ncbi:MAG: cellulase family glycosylhydrolase [Paludibacteraceae bacterium]|nr:cellulase family glycosylhydrolase [Paludibacteraceae bacterium]
MKKLLLSALALASFMQVSALDYSSESACLSNNYVQQWGKLKLVGNQLSSERGEPVQLRGWSTHGKQWSGAACFDEKSDFEGMKKFGANIARIAMYLTEGGYKDENWVKSCIDWTADLGMYCLVDWHILTPGLPTDNQYMNQDPKGFFKNIAQYVKQKGYKHVLYEICNEPNEDTEGNIYRPYIWEEIRDYADEILPAIAEVDPDAVVIVGTPQWDQAVVFPMEYPLESTYGLNVMYTFHYYACSHEVYLGGFQAAAGNIPLFVTEWGTTEHKGQSGMCREESDMLMNTCNGANLGNQIISWCNWSFSTEGGESKSLNSANNYNEGNLSNSGKYIVQQLRKGDVTSMPKASTPYKGEAQKITRSGVSILNPELYDEGGEGVAYHEFDAQWLWDQFNMCQASIGEGKMDKNFRSDDCVDVAYVDDDHTYCNIGYIVEGEWVKYTVDVEEPGYYEMIPLANAHKSENVIAISVDGQNAIRDLNDKENTKIGAIRLKINGTPQNDGGYSDWGETKFYSKYDGKKEADTNYGIYFPKAGKQVLSIAFMTECAGLSQIKFIPEDHAGVEDVEAEAVASIYPNPSVNGNFTVNAQGEADVVVYDFSGKVVFSATVNGQEEVKANLKAGVYAVKVSSDNSTNVSKLVVR